MATDTNIPLELEAPLVPPTDHTIPVDDGASPVSVSPDVIKERAAKFNFALAENSPGLVALETELNAGHEDRLRTAAALENDSKLRQARFDIIDGMAKRAVDEGRELSRAERQTILDLSNSDIKQLRTNPETFIEREYARRVLDKANEIGDPLFDRVAETDEDYAFSREDIFVDVVAAKEGFQKLADEENKRAKDQSWAGWGFDMATSMIPGFLWYNRNNALKGFEGTSILPGANLSEQVDYLYSIPPEQAIPLAREAINELRGKNQLMAQSFANALVEYPSSSKLIDDLFIGGVDIATFGTFAAVKGAATFARSAETLGRGAKAALDVSTAKLAKVVTKPKVHLSEVADAMGDVDTTTSLTVLERIGDRLSVVPSGAKAGFEDLMNQIPGFVNFDEVMGGVRSSLSAETVRRITDKLGGYTDDALRALFINPTSAARLTPETLRVAIQEQREVFRNLYRLPEDSIIRITTTEAGESGVDAIFAKIHFGDNTGGLFESEEHAFNYAIDVIGLKAGDFRTIPEGNSWYLEVARPIDETSRGVRASLRIDREGATDLGNLVGKALASIRSGADVLPKDIHESLVNSVVGGSKLARLLTDMTKDFLPLKDKKAFYDFLDKQRRFHDGTDAVRVGKYSETIGEFEVDWAAMHGRLPTEEEVQAYFTYTKLNDIHLVSRNLSLYTDKIRTGHANYKIDGISTQLEGKIIPDGHIPQGTPEDVGRILVINPRRNEIPVNLSNYGTKALDELKDDITNKNLVVIQLSPHGRQVAKDLSELSDLGGPSGIDFIVAPRHWVREEALSLRQLPRRPGGHIMYEDDATAIAQPRVFRQFGDDGREKVLKYYGDNIIITANKNVDPADLAKRYDTARIMLRDLKAGKVPGQTANAAAWKTLREYVTKNLPMTYKQFLHDYSKKGTLDLDLPILYTKMNSSLDETWNLVDHIAPGENILYTRESDSAYNTYAGQVNLKYAQERGLLLGEVANIGSKDAPLYGLRQTSLIDPMTALERSMQSIVRGRSHESAKWEAAEKFVAEFGGPNGVLKASDNELYKDPVMAMLHAEFRNDADPDLLRAAQVYRARVQQFFGLYRTPDQTAVSYTVNKILSQVDKDSGKFFDMAAHKVLSMKDPVQKFKAIAFHSTMGFFNIKQLLLNANTSTHIIGIAGPNIGSRAVAAALVNSIAMHGGKSLDGVAAKMIGKLGFSKEEYLESLEAMRRAGWDHVGREVATREQHMNAQVLASKAGKFLDAGLLPFKKSEEFIRNAAWNAAYLEWRSRNPSKKLNDANIRSLVARADNLSVNMTQASNSALQEGSAAFATQFWSYQMRMTEQFTGRRLSAQEKIRLFSTYSAVYGLPIGVSGVIGIWPVHDSLRQFYLDKQIDVDNNLISKFVNDGAISLISEIFMGEKTNVNQVYGPNGIPFFFDMLSQDTSVVEALTGASGSVLARYLEDTLPVIPWAISLLNPSSPSIQPKLEDFWDVVGNINSLSQAEKAYYAINYGKLFDKYGSAIDPKFEGIKGFLYSLTGTLPDRVEDYYALYSLDVQSKKTKMKQEKLIKEDLRKSYGATNVDEEMSYMRRAQARSLGAGYDPLELSKIIVESLKENRSLLENRFLNYRDRTLEEREFLRQKYNKYRIQD